MAGGGPLDILWDWEGPYNIIYLFINQFMQISGEYVINVLSQVDFLKQKDQL